jgi:2-dehydro-3-deoxyphosphogluconate aldolase / (4S)-4-hydroxy-2-oxoglutarate aldolase
MSPSIDDIMKASPVIPVIVVKSLDSAVPLAKALVQGGLRVLEITLRTPVALAAIRKIKAEVPEAIVGAGTVIDLKTLDEAIESGAQFLVSPGTTEALLDAALDTRVPILPGAATPTEVMRLLDRGIREMKFFPAEAAGGVAMLKSIAGPLPQATFCPTGGINPENAREYLTLDNVACVGGSWMAPAELIDTGNWSEITRRASEAARLGR